MKERKKTMVILLSFFNVPLSIILSLLIHTKLSQISFAEVEIDRTLLLLFFLIYMFIETVIIALFSIGNKYIFESEVVNITDKLKTPEIAGQGQHGTARWLKEKEFEKSFKNNVLEDDTEKFD